MSLEMAVAFHGWIPEAVDTVTSVCGERSRSFNPLVPQTAVSMHV